VIYDDLVAETLIQPLPDAGPPVDTEPVADLPPAVHDAMTCDVCKAWLAHVRDAEAR
jgi:hypothetical protein